MNKKKIIPVIAVILVMIGLVFVKNMYASQSYKSGKQAYENEDYALAAEKLHQAYKWDCDEEDLVMMYGNASYEIQNYTQVIRIYETLDTLTTQQDQQLQVSYEYLINQYLEDGNTTKAIQVLKKKTEASPCHHDVMWLSALQKQENVTDEYGVTFTPEGKIVEINAYGQDIIIAYEDGYFASMTNDNEKVIDRFDFSEENTTYNVTWTDGIPPWTQEKQVMDEEGNVIQIDTYSEGNHDQVQYTYHRNSAGRIDKQSEWHLLDDSSSTWVYRYEDGVLLSKDQTVRGTSQGSYVLYEYNEDGLLESMKEYDNLTDLVFQEEYTYTDGIVSQIVRFTNGQYETIDYTIEAYKQIYATITVNGKVVADSYYVNDNGWITIYRKDTK